VRDARVRSGVDDDFDYDDHDDAPALRRMSELAPVRFLSGIVRVLFRVRLYAVLPVRRRIHERVDLRSRKPATCLQSDEHRSRLL